MGSKTRPKLFLWDVDPRVAHHFGPTDVKTKYGVAYGPILAGRLAKEDPDEAMNNADNYNIFVNTLARNAAALKVGHVVPVPRTCEIRGKPFPVSKMCKRLSVYNLGCDADPSIKPHTKIEIMPFTPVCYPFCKIVEMVMERDGLQDCGS